MTDSIHAKYKLQIEKNIQFDQHVVDIHHVPGIKVQARKKERKYLFLAPRNVQKWTDSLQNIDINTYQI